MNKNTCGRKFNIHCKTSESWLKLKYNNSSSNNDNNNNNKSNILFKKK